MSCPARNEEPTYLTPVITISAAEYGEEAQKQRHNATDLRLLPSSSEISSTDGTAFRRALKSSMLILITITPATTR